ncbi:hypothetical protein AKJ16_DCAP09298 [Drosera capensis]
MISPRIDGYRFFDDSSMILRYLSVSRNGRASPSKPARLGLSEVKYVPIQHLSVINLFRNLDQLLNTSRSLGPTVHENISRPRPEVCLSIRFILKEGDASPGAGINCGRQTLLQANTVL